MTIKKVTISEKVQRFTIWDNYARHCEELRGIGATESDLAALREEAEKVDTFERQEAMELGRNPALGEKSIIDLTAPYTCVNGWVVNPPSAVARRYALQATAKITGGTSPDDLHAVMGVVLTGLYLLMLWGRGERDNVMQLVCSSGRIAEMLPGLIDDADPAQFDGLVDDYCHLMGTKKKAAMKAYQDLAESLLGKYGRNTTPA